MLGLLVTSYFAGKAAKKMVNKAIDKRIAEGIEKTNQAQGTGSTDIIAEAKAKLAEKKSGSSESASLKELTEKLEKQQKENEKLAEQLKNQQNASIGYRPYPPRGYRPAPNQFHGQPNPFAGNFNRHF